MFDSAFPIITTPDLDRALRFFRDVLGGTVSYAFPPDGPPAYVGVDLDTSHLALGHDPEMGLADEQRIARWVYAADCDADVDAVREAGGTVVEEPVDRPWGERVARVLDSDGNRIVVGAALIDEVAAELPVPDPRPYVAPPSPLSRRCEHLGVTAADRRR